MTDPLPPPVRPALPIDPQVDPTLELGAFITDLGRPLGDIAAVDELRLGLSLEAPVPLPRADDRVRAAVRDLLRKGGFKPTGRSKPASEYLLRAAGDGALASINAAVDACNVASLHSGLPISVIDLDRAAPPLRVALPPPGASYVFNPAGQVIDIGGLVSLWDAEGPCAGPVKDSQRTKTHPGTRRTLSLVWGTRALPGLTAATTAYYRELLHRLGAATEEVPLA
jgi:DNA/RNA-binding domain of Phe-tRNA-synthetase-like protein